LTAIKTQRARCHCRRSASSSPPRPSSSQLGVLKSTPHPVKVACPIPPILSRKSVQGARTLPHVGSLRRCKDSCLMHLRASHQCRSRQLPHISLGCNRVRAGLKTCNNTMAYLRRSLRTAKSMCGRSGTRLIKTYTPRHTTRKSDAVLTEL
jgi:hypothetical protein